MQVVTTSMTNGRSVDLLRSILNRTTEQDDSRRK